MLQSTEPLPAIGEAIRGARLARGESLRSVASAVGISPSMMSQIETGRNWPSVRTLQGVAGHLSISIDRLLGLGDTTSGPGVSVPAVQHRDHDPLFEVAGVLWRRLANDGTTLAAPLIGTFRPGARSSLEGITERPDGSRYGVVLEGAMTLILDDEAFVLRTGDSLAVPGRRAQVYFNHTSTPARLLCHLVG